MFTRFCRTVSAGRWTFLAVCLICLALLVSLVDRAHQEGYTWIVFSCLAYLLVCPWLVR